MTSSSVPSAPTPVGAVVAAFSASAASAAALRLALEEGGSRAAPVVVLHVEDPGVGTCPRHPRERDAVTREVLGDRIGRILGETPDAEDEDRPGVIVTFRRGPLLDVLVEAARGASALVVGRAEGCRHDRLPAELQGRVDCPVLVVPATQGV